MGPPRFREGAVAGVKVELFEEGAGRPLLYLHGGDGLEPDVPFLEGLSKHFSVLAVSHPGFGASELPGWISEVDDLAYLYLDLLEERGLEGVTLVGAGLGGWIACDMLIKDASRFARAVLIDAFGVKFGGLDSEEYADIFTLTRDAQAAFYFHTPRQAVQPTELDDALRIARAREALSLYGWSPLLHDPKLLGRLRRVKTPTLVLWGESDRVVSVEHGRKLAAAIQGAEFALISEAGHHPQVEQPARVIEKIKGSAA